MGFPGVSLLGGQGSSSVKCVCGSGLWISFESLWTNLLTTFNPTDVYGLKKKRIYWRLKFLKYLAAYIFFNLIISWAE